MGSDEDNPEGQKVGRNYIVTRYLAGGSFGRLYIGKNIKTGEQVAIKMEKKSIDKPQLVFEFAFFRKLKAEGTAQRGIPSIHYFGQCGAWNALVMDLLGPSLEKVHKECGLKFSLKTTILLSVQLFEIFEYFHGKGLIYRDIKPENFLFGPSGSEKYSTVHIIDLGLCKEYLDESGQHIGFATNKMMTGTIRYMSVSSHLRQELSRKDDMEALGYMFVFFLKGELPWQGMKGSTQMEKYDNVGKLKAKIKPEELCSDLPKEFAQYMKDVRSLKFEDTPKYKQYIISLTKLFQKSGFKNDSGYDFDKNHRTRSQT